MRRDTCPSDQTLEAFNLGDLPEGDLDTVREHQESCPRCEMRGRLLEHRTDPFIDDLRRTALGGTMPPRASRSNDSGPATSPREGVAWPGRGHPGLSDYEVIEPPLGTRSMGIVYKARHRKLDRDVALKMIAGRSSQVSALFQIEAKAVAQLQHPNIVQIFEIGQHEGQPFLVLEYVERGSLEREVSGWPLAPRQAAEFVRTLALAADYAHRRGIVHCDLKPSNILITLEGVPKITDFGVAKWLKSEHEWGEDGDVVGTPRYMAPEQATGRVEIVGPASDIYSLGVLLYEMLTGKTPHHAATSIETLDQIRDREPPSPRLLEPRLPRDLETIALKCLRREPARRFADARALAEDLARFLAGDPIHARPVGHVELAILRTRRHPALVGVLAITTLWVATLGFFQQRHDEMLHQFDADLKKVTLPEPTANYLTKPVLVSQKADGSVHLKAFEAAASGTTLVFEPRFGNIGHWVSVDDRAVWTFRVDRTSRFTLAVDYSNANSGSKNSFEVVVGGVTLRDAAVGTCSWSDFRSFSVGEVKLPAGVYFLEVRPVGPLRKALFDLRSVTLVPR